MTGTIVVPLDGSELAERALPYAIRMARSRGDQLVLLRVALASAPMTIEGTQWERDQRDAVEESERYLEGVLVGVKDVPASLEVPYGPAAREILAAVRRLHATSVVMATHGRTGLSHLLHGSVAEEVLAASHVPVLLVRSHVGPPAELPDAPRLLVPLDATALSEAAVDTALEYLRGAAQGTLVLATVVAEPDHVERDERGRVLAYLDQQEAAQTRGARDYLERVAATLRQQAPETVAIAVDVTIGSPEEAIAALATAHQSNLIVMATHARTGVDRIRLGSVAGGVLRTSALPVLLVRPDVAVFAGVKRR